MNFFQQLFQLAAGVDITLRIKEKAGKLTVMVTPEAGNKSSLKGRVITATPEELDAAFFESITPIVDQAKGAVIQDLKGEEKHAKEKSDEKPAPKKADKKAAKKKKGVPTKKTEAKVQAASMFDQPTEAASEEPANDDTDEPAADDQQNSETE